MIIEEKNMPIIPIEIEDDNLIYHIDEHQIHYYKNFQKFFQFFYFPNYYE